MAVRPALNKSRVSIDRSIERLRKQLAELGLYLGKAKARPDRSLEDFDLQTEHVLSDLFGEHSEWLDAYEYAAFGEASGLVNMTEEAPESLGLDGERQNLLQRIRVLESAVAELEARRAAEPKRHRMGRHTLIGPQVVEHMSTDLRTVSQSATLREAGRLMQEWKTGSLLVTDNHAYVGFITDSILARDVVANNLDPGATPVKTCMRTPLVAIRGDRPLIEAVRMMKDQSTRHLAVQQDGQILGVITVSNILRYYSGVV